MIGLCQAVVTPVTRALRARNLMAMAFFELARPMAELLDPGMLP